MGRPTIALCLITKNEEKNLPVLLDSVVGCFDEIHVTDTGSTDSTVDIALSYGAKVRKFEWIDDFAAARNESIKEVSTDYWMWLDADDCLPNREEFISFRDHSMCMADVWLANYHYASDEKGNPVCTFVRERVMKTSHNLKWKYPVHEGVIPQGSVNFISTWAVKHRRTLEDLEKDKGRNLKIFEKNIDTFDSRMTYYYGKELFEAGRAKESISWMSKAAMFEDLEHHDRMLCLQYLCFALMKENNFDAALQFAHQGLVLEPNRAEFYVILGDCYLKKGQFTNSIPMYNAAKKCQNHSGNRMHISPVFQHKDAYGPYPRNMLARVYANIGNLDEAANEAQKTVNLFNNEEAKLILAEINRIKERAIIKDTVEKTEDIVITCPPGGMYEWDSKVYREYGIGGSETAAVEMAENLHKITGNKIKIFHSRKENFEENGVQYIKIEELNDYFSKYEPKAHIAWRHTTKMTNAKTYVWSHDLVAMGADNIGNYHKVLVLSEFHKHFLHSILGVSYDKMIVFRNGIVPHRFPQKPKKSEFGKVVFSSSPDRGLDDAIRVMDEVVKEIPEAKLHCFYGFDNMKKMGKLDEVKRYEDMISSRPYIIHHGNVTQSQLTEHIKDAQVWLYPTNFLETYCITAIEMLLSKVYPVVRNFGALPYTMSEAVKQGYCSVLEADPSRDLGPYIRETISAIRENKCELIALDPEKYSWESVAKEFMGIMNG